MHFTFRSLLLLTLTSAPAVACGICSLAIVDRHFPPAFFWFWWPVAWFLAATLLTSAFRVRLRFLPSLLAGVAASVAAIFLGAAAFGPLSTLPLALSPVLSLASVLRSGAGTPLLRRLHLFLGVLFLLVAVIVGGRGLVVARNRTDAEYICSWSSTGPARAVFKGLAAKGPLAAPDYRFILRHSEYEYLLADTAEALARVGATPADAAVLQQALRRTPPGSDSATRIAKVIASLTTAGGV